MGIFAWILPAGVTVYFITTNLFTMVQQYVQLEHDGFYDEKLAGLRKMGEDAKLHQRLYLKFMENGTKVMVVLRLREKPKIKSKKKPSPAAAEAARGVGGAEAKAPVSSGQGKKPSQAKPKTSSAAKTGKDQSPGEKKKGSGKSGSRQGKAQSYPAKKKSTKK